MSQLLQFEHGVPFRNVGLPSFRLCLFFCVYFRRSEEGEGLFLKCVEAEVDSGLACWREVLIKLFFASTFLWKISRHRQSCTGSVVVAATCATTPLSQRTMKTEDYLRPRTVRNLNEQHLKAEGNLVPIRSSKNAHVRGILALESKFPSETEAPKFHIRVRYKFHL